MWSCARRHAPGHGLVGGCGLFKNTVMSLDYDSVSFSLDFILVRGPALSPQQAVTSEGTHPPFPPSEGRGEGCVWDTPGCSVFSFFFFFFFLRWGFLGWDGLYLLCPGRSPVRRGGLGVGVNLLEWA